MLIVSEEKYFVGVSFENDEVGSMAEQSMAEESETLGYTSF